MSFLKVINLFFVSFNLINLLLIPTKVHSEETIPSANHVKFFSTNVLKKNHLEFSFKVNNQNSGRILFDPNNSNFIDRGLSVNAPKSINWQWPFEGNLEKIGTIDIQGKGNEEIFVVTAGSGAGLSYYNLHLLNPINRKMIRLTLTSFHDPSNPITRIGRSKNFGKEDLKKEARFLEKIKNKWSWVVTPKDLELEQDNPVYAYYFWKTNNGSIQDGLMLIKKYSGKPSPRNGVNAELKAGYITYRGYLKSGVVAYNEIKDEHYVLFFPKNNYSWPTFISKKDQYLIIGTRGEGLAIINLDTFHLKRYLPESAGNDIWDIRDTGQALLINQYVVFDYPSF